MKTQTTPLKEIFFTFSYLVMTAVVLNLFSANVAHAAPVTVVQSVTYNSETITMRMSLQNLRGGNFELWTQNASGTYDVVTPVDERSYIGRDFNIVHGCVSHAECESGEERGGD